MHDAHSGPLEKTAALLERAYRMALVLQGRICADDVEARDVRAGAFEEFVIAKELVAILDEARVALLAQAAGTTGSEE